MDAKEGRQRNERIFFNILGINNSKNTKKYRQRAKYLERMAEPNLELYCMIERPESEGPGLEPQQNGSEDWRKSVWF